MSYHELEIEGYVGRVDDMRYTPAGKAVFSFSMPTDIFTKQGEEKKSNWWRVTVWDKQAEFLSEKVVKGMHLLVKGEVGEPQVYQDKKTGENKVGLQMTARTVRFLDRAGTVVGEGTAAPEAAGGNHDEDIPF